MTDARADLPDLPKARNHHADHSREEFEPRRWTAGAVLSASEGRCSAAEQRSEKRRAASRAPREPSEEAAGV